MNRILSPRRLIAMGLAAALMVPVMAQAQPRRDWHGRDDYRHYDHRGPSGGAILGGALLGLGAAAVAGGIIASQSRPPAYYAPPPVYYAPPPPAYYAAPPVVYGY